MMSFLLSQQNQSGLHANAGQNLDQSTLWMHPVIGQRGAVAAGDMKTVSYIITKNIDLFKICWTLLILSS